MSTPAWLIRLACTAHGGAASLAECRDLCEWFGVERRRATIQKWYQEYVEYHNQDFTVEPDRIAVDEKQIQLENEEKAWLYAAIDVDTKVVLYVQISQHRGCDPPEQFLPEKETPRPTQSGFSMVWETSLHLLEQTSVVTSTTPTEISLRSYFRRS